MKRSRSARARRVHGPGVPAPIGTAVEAGHRQDPGDRRAHERLVGRAEVVGRQPRLDGPEPRAVGPAQQPRARRARQDRAVERRGRELRDAVGRASNEEDVGRRRLRQVAGHRQEQRVVGALAAGLEPREDVVRAARRLERHDRVLRVPAHARRDQRQAAFEVVRRGRDHRPRLDHDRRRRACSSRGGSRPRDAHVPRETVIRSEASPSGPSRPSAASSSAMAGRSSPLERGGQLDAEPVRRAPEPCRRAPRARSRARRARAASRTGRHRAGIRGRTPTGASRRPAAARR